ncbi:MAG: endonuclease domain-containing protein [Oscillospiraceae bacterium]|nr:endonuclease domain-containing protein [Oscillospiraceae bacterium]
MNKTNNSRLTGNAQKLRREMTEEERHLWYDFLKSLPVTVNRQKVIGRYIVDFYCAEAKLVIEIDGTQHYEQAGKETDSERDAYLNSMGLHVLRYSNRDVNRSFAGVCAEIMTHLPTSSASLRSAPSPQGEGE